MLEMRCWSMNKFGKLVASGIVMRNLKGIAEKDPEEQSSQIDSYSCNHCMPIIIKIVKKDIEFICLNFSYQEVRNIIKSYKYF
jgi:hypothetical protein